MTTTPPTTPATPEEPASGTAPEPVQTDTLPQEPADTPEVDKRRKDPAKEAAGYRMRLRDVEAHRDTLRDQLTASRRQSVEQLLEASVNLRGDDSPPKTLHKPADLWDVLQATPDQFYDEAGNLDRLAVASYIDEKTEGRDYLTVTRPVHRVLPFGAASSSMQRPPAGVAGGIPDWQAALKPGRRTSHPETETRSGTLCV